MNEPAERRLVLVEPLAEPPDPRTPEPDPDDTPGDPSGSSTPESLLEFLSDHTQRTQRRRERNRGARRRRLNAALLLVIVAALAFVGLNLLIWGNFTHVGFGSRGAPSSAKHQTTAGRTARAGHAAKPRHAAIGTSAARKADKAAKQRTVEGWHRGLSLWRQPTKPRVHNIYYEWIRSHYHCAGTATYGCWKTKVVTRSGCPKGVTVVVEQTLGGAQVGTIVGFSKPLAPKKPAYIELDASQANVDAQLASMDCN